MIIFISSCTIPRRYQKGKPFTYKTTVSLKDADLNNSARQQLRSSLINQVDDSLQVRTVIAVRPVPPFFYNRLSRPAVFDTSYISRSKTYMTALLKSQGYFSPVIRDTFRIDTVREQQRAYVHFTVIPGNALRFDSIGYDLQTPALQQLAMANKRQAIIKKNDNYSINGLSSELDRLLNMYRDNGYYKITKEDFYVEHDTVVAALIDPSLDPFEQFELLDSLSRKKREPTINVVFKQRVPKDSSRLFRYQWGDIDIYPDRSLTSDTASSYVDSSRVAGYDIFRTSRRFKKHFLARNVSIKSGELYRQSDYFKTINSFTNLGAWAQVDVDLLERSDSLHYLDADILLYPAKKQSLTIDFETSRNVTDLLSTGSLFGIGLNLGIRNRNAFRESIATATNLRFGVELGPGIVQTLQATFSHNIYIPRFIAPFRIRGEKNLVAPRTVINFNTSYTNRRQFVEVQSVNTSWGYNWSKKNHSWEYTPFNFEYTRSVKSDSLQRLAEEVPSILQAFNDGLIISQIGSYSVGGSRGNHFNNFKARIEESGAIAGLFRNLDRGELRRFVKVDLEYKHYINRPKSAWAFRAFAGYGYVYGKTGDSVENNLPFFKAYFGGGPYTMRAWAVRRLGLGSSNYYDQLNSGKGTDRWGDMKLEANIEYRFDIGRLFGIKLKSALFTDIGNIWATTYNKEGDKVEAAEFKLSRLYNDLAVGAGTSLRFDFDFFLIRLDWAYQIKNPVFSSEQNGGWFHDLELNSGQFQLGIGYPF